MSRTSHCLVPFALCAMGLFAFVCAGCKKEPDAEPAVDPSSPASYMNDKAFLGKLDAVKAEQIEVMKKHRCVFADYKKALEGDPKAEKPETQALRQSADELEQQYKALRQKMQATVRERVSPRK